MNSQKKISLLFKRDGTCQVERLTKNLVNTGALIDDKPLDEYLVFTYLYTDLIKYYDHQNTATSRNVWREFLENDDTVILSLILHTEISQLRSSINNDFLVLTKEKKISSDNKYIKRLLGILQELILLIDYWHRNLSGRNKVKIELATLITYELNDSLTLLYGLLRQWHSQSASEPFVKFCAFVESICKEESPWKLIAKSLHEDFVSDALANSAKNVLKDLLDSILSSLLSLQMIAKKNYTKTLNSQRHTPQNALLIAFLRLLRYVSARLNQIPQRHIDFYYKEVLKFSNQPIQAEKAIVHFQLQKKIEHYLLPRGTKLSAGKDAKGRDILFKTDRALLINMAVIKKVHKVHQSVQLHGKDGFLPIGNISAATYDEEALSKQQLNDPSEQTNASQQTPKIYFLGLVVSSPILKLKEGHRHISVKLGLNDKSFATFVARVKRDKEESVQVIQERLSSLFREAIDVCITSKEQWLKLPPASVSATISTTEKNCLDFKLSLSPDISPIVDPDEEIHGETYGLQEPAVRFGLNDETHFGAIYLLKDLVLDKVTLEVAVKDYRGLILQNDQGLLDSSQPFQPFGPLPQLHNNFYLGSNEIFNKSLRSFKINIAWGELPVEKGWEQHYQGYPKNITNEDFRVSISYLNHRQWHPFYADYRQEALLFSTNEAESNGIKKLNDKHVIDGIDLDRLNLTEANAKLATSLLTPETLSGFLRLELCSPDMAFGHNIYPNLMSSTFIQNANNKGQITPEPLNKPYTPLIKSLSVDYSAREELMLTGNAEASAGSNSQALIRLAPFGYKQIFPSKGGPVSFLSDSESVGCFLCFGFEHLSTSLLAFHIQIDQHSIDPEKVFPKPTWQYLSCNDWINFKHEEIISDGTDGLTKSGIMVLKIPEATNTDNTLLSSGLTWIRALFLEDLDALPELVSIHTQAVGTSRVIDKYQTDTPSLSLKPGSIQSIVGSPPAIKSVIQPFSTFGGKPAESPGQLYTRSSERLRHKNRAVSVWDYERLILEKFPEIFRAKCINHSSKAQPFVSCPGKVIIVVISKLQNRNKKGTYTHGVSRQLLGEIERYLQSVASPFVNFEVMNPTYEEVKVTAEVKFKPLYEKGIYLNKLQVAIKNFLSPWLFDKSKDAKLGGVIPSAKIIDFISKREYIEGIGNFSILKYAGKGETLTITRITNYNSYVQATYPWSVIVSADRHKISAVDTINTCKNIREGGVADMSIGEDFVVGPWQTEGVKNRDTEDKEAAPHESLEEYYLVTKKKIKRTAHGHS